MKRLNYQDNRDIIRDRKRQKYQQKNLKEKLDTNEKLQHLNDQVPNMVEFLENEELNFMVKNDNFTRYPNIALLLFHYCCTDPKSHICNNESLRDKNTPEWKRIKSHLEKPPSVNTIKQAQEEINKYLHNNNPIWCCCS